MRAPASPQARFLLRGSGLFIVLLAVWWWILLSPMLAGLRLSTRVVLWLGARGGAAPGGPGPPGRGRVVVDIAIAHAGGPSALHARGAVAGARRKLRLGRHGPTGRRLAAAHSTPRISGQAGCRTACLRPSPRSAAGECPVLPAGDR